MITPIDIDSEDFFVVDKERSLMSLVFYGVHINPDPLYRIVTQGVRNSTDKSMQMYAILCKYMNI